MEKIYDTPGIRAPESFFWQALLVDEMLTSREIVVKAVGPQLASIRGVSGATILGDGSISLILDVYELVNLTIGRQARRKQAQLGFDRPSPGWLGSSV